MIKNFYICIFQDCRRFVNAFNNQLGASRLVHTFAAISSHLGALVVVKPRVASYQRLWVDFNLGSGTVSVLCDKSDPTVPSADRLWETITGLPHKILSYNENIKFALALIIPILTSCSLFFLINIL